MIIKQMFFEHQISIGEQFLKDHVAVILNANNMLLFLLYFTV